MVPYFSTYKALVIHGYMSDEKDGNRQDYALSKRYIIEYRRFRTVTKNKIKYDKI